jgi:hypothetical protein
MTVRITVPDARRLAITAQRLAGARPKPTGGGILEVARDIGYLQLDPTNVVARNPLLVLWTRIGRYEARLLEDLVRRRAFFETVSLLVPMSDLAIHVAAMRAYRAATSPGAGPSPRGILPGAGGGTWPQRAAQLVAQNPQLRRRILARLKRDGPLPLAAFADRAMVSWTSGDRNDERNVTIMLAILQRRGEVVVAGRRRAQKVYALADGSLPKVALLSPSALAREATLRAARALGVATLKQLRAHYAFGEHVTADALASLERDGSLARVEIGDASKAWPGRWYASGDVATRLRALRDEWNGRTTLLSPFDNLIIDRDRTEQLFGYRYRIEIYVPPHSRKRGYWAMPVLHDDRIVGSVDPRFDRARGELIVNKVVLEPGSPRTATRAMRRAVEELAGFVGAAKVAWPKS